MYLHIKDDRSYTGMNNNIVAASNNPGGDPRRHGAAPPLVVTNPDRSFSSGDGEPAGEREKGWMNMIRAS